VIAVEPAPVVLLCSFDILRYPPAPGAVGLRADGGVRDEPGLGLRQL